MRKIKTQKLLKLRSKVIDKIYKERWEEVWFFPSYKGVKGYLGIQDIIFLSINPSMGTFPSWVDKQYYRQLKRQRFSNAHLTDVFKQRSKDWRKLARDKKATAEAKIFLLEEIRIIKPKLIVLVGGKYKQFYSTLLSGVEIEKFTIRHYAFRYANKKKLRAKIRKEIKKVRDKYNAMDRKKEP